MNRWLLPGRRVLSCLRHRVKFSLLSIIFIAPLVALGLFLIAQINEEVDSLQHERVGLKYIRNIRPLIQLIPQHRGMSGAFLNGEPAFREKMLAKQQAIDSALSVLLLTDERLSDDLNTGSRVRNLHSAWDSLKKRVFEMTPARSFEEHTALIADLLALTERAAVQSELVLDSNLDTYYLMDMVVFRLPMLTEGMGQARAIGSGAAARGRLDKPGWARLAIRLDRIEKAEEALARGLRAIFEKNPVLQRRLDGLGAQVHSTVVRFSDLIERDLLNAEPITVPTTEIFGASTQAINAVFGLYDTVMPAFDELLQHRITDGSNTVNGAIAAMAVVLVLLLYLRSLEAANLELEERVNARTAELEAANQRIGSIIENASDAIVKIDGHQMIRLFNPGAERMFGYRSDEILGQPLSILLPQEARAFHARKVDMFSQGSALSPPDYGHSEIQGLRKDGTLFPAEATVSRMEVDGELYFTAFVRDVSERKAAEERIRLLAMTDSLTGLANRHHFEQELKEAMAHADRFGYKVGLLLLDLDNFKPVNDTYGHQAGDKLLKQVAAVLRENLREIDVVGRLGGDEFSVVISGLKNARDLGPIAEKLLNRIAQLRDIDGSPIRIGASMGVSVYPDHGSETEALLETADKALYAAKAQGKNTYSLYGQHSADA